MILQILLFNEIKSSQLFAKQPKLIQCAVPLRVNLFTAKPDGLQAFLDITGKAEQTSLGIRLQKGYIYKV